MTTNNNNNNVKDIIKRMALIQKYLQRTRNPLLQSQNTIVGYVPMQEESLKIKERHQNNTRNMIKTNDVDLQPKNYPNNFTYHIDSNS
jgi:hypothetical protein